MNDHILREHSVILNDEEKSGNVIDLIKVFEVEKPRKSKACFFGGDGWDLNTDKYTAELVKFNID